MIRTILRAAKVMVFIGGLLAATAFGAWVVRGFPSLPDLAGVTSVETAAETETGTIEVAPIHLDCRSRINASVPLEISREHKVGGVTYRTDTLTMTAIGDVDTCVEGATTRINVTSSGAVQVRIPSDSIEFVRPRVDAVATGPTVKVSKGLVGKLTDQYPWVSDDLGLTPQGYALGQAVIGSSECMTAALDSTEQILIESYTEHALQKGATKVDVQIVGRVEPPPPLDASAHNADSLEIGEITCTETADGQL